MDPTREHFHDSASEPDWDEQADREARAEFHRDPIGEAVRAVRYLIRRTDSLPRRARVERDLAEKSRVSASDAETAVGNALADGFLATVADRDRGQRAQLYVPEEHDNLAQGAR